MALAKIMKNHFSFLFCLVSLFSISVEFCSCRSFNHNASLAFTDGFSAGVATFYGDPFGAGSVGGACGYGDAVAHPPYNAFVSAGSSSDLYKGGAVCGACFQVKCTSHPACSGAPVTVTIIDECPGGCSPSASNHFDLSGTAMNAMAKSGQGGQLRAAGVINIQYQRVNCNYLGPHIAFRMDQGANGFFFAFVTEYVSGDGTLGLVEVQPANSGFLPMTRNFGASWKINSPTMLRGPFSIRITTLESRRQATAVNVIPANWAAGQTYISNIF